MAGRTQTDGNIRESKETDNASVLFAIHLYIRKTRDIFPTFSGFFLIFFKGKYYYLESGGLVMKLNYKRTFFVGFAFFLICLFWQAYDNIIPKILIDKFGMSQTWSGFIMALDNILALFMLPLFGAISDKCKSKWGRRTPFIVVGTICAVLLFFGLSFVDNHQKALLGEATEFVTDDNGLRAIDPAGMEKIWESEKGKTLSTSDGKVFTLGPAGGASGRIFLHDEFVNIKAETAPGVFNEEFEYVTAARESYAGTVSRENRGTLVLFIVVLLLLLVSMATFRSPAVALMPDVTIKPLRSKANAVINLMGSAGGILVLILGMVFATGKYYNAMISYTRYFGIICALMLLALVVFLLKVREPRFVQEMKKESKKYGIVELDEDAPEEMRKLSKGERKSLVFLMISIVFWFMGYNAVTSKYSVYAGDVLNLDYNLTLIIAQAAAILAYFPVGIVASKVGRKKTIIAGIFMLGISFGIASTLREGSNPLIMNAMFALAGIGWATINVNSFPMVVELAKGGDVGKYTGFYYTASMAAQTITPFFSGFLMDSFGRMTVLFPYATVFVGLAVITMLFVKHGDSKPSSKEAIQEAFADMDD